MTNLERLVIRGPFMVSDLGVVHLEGLKNLTHLSLQQSHVTGAGIRNLQQALPECEIITKVQD